MVIWTKPATADLKAIHDYIAADSRFYARKVTHEIREKSELLDDFPQLGKVTPETQADSMRPLYGR